jgi:hypothetical protein
LKIYDSKGKTIYEETDLFPLLASPQAATTGYIKIYESDTSRAVNAGWFTKFNNVSKASESTVPSSSKIHELGQLQSTTLNSKTNQIFTLHGPNIRRNFIDHFYVVVNDQTFMLTHFM